MDTHSQAAIICNDLDSLRYRIEALPAHPKMRDALGKVTEAKKAVLQAMVELHQTASRAPTSADVARIDV